MGFFDEGDYEQCRNCGEKYYYPLKGDEFYHGQSYCKECASACDVCGEYSPNDSMTKVGSRKVCDACMDKILEYVLNAMDEEKDKRYLLQEGQYIEFGYPSTIFTTLVYLKSNGNRTFTKEDLLEEIIDNIKDNEKLVNALNENQRTVTVRCVDDDNGYCLWSVKIKVPENY